MFFLAKSIYFFFSTDSANGAVILTSYMYALINGQFNIIILALAVMPAHQKDFVSLCI